MILVANSTIKLILLICTLSVAIFACNKSDFQDFDESDPTIYTFEIIYYRYPFKKNSDSDVVEYDFSQNMIEYNRDIVKLTNKQANALHKKHYHESRVKITKLNS